MPMFISSDQFVREMEAQELCDFCSHPRKDHHKGCAKCFSIPQTHGHFCNLPLCSCIEFLEPTLTDEDYEALFGETA